MKRFSQVVADDIRNCKHTTQSYNTVINAERTTKERGGRTWQPVMREYDRDWTLKLKHWWFGLYRRVELYRGKNTRPIPLTKEEHYHLAGVIKAVFALKYERLKQEQKADEEEKKRKAMEAYWA